MLRWKRKYNIDWSEDVRTIEVRAGETSLNEFAELELKKKIEKLMDWIRDVNDVIFGRQTGDRVHGRVRWWTDELERERKKGCIRATASS